MSAAVQQVLAATDSIIARLDAIAARHAAEYALAQNARTPFAETVIAFDPFDQTPTATDGPLICENIL